ncbi:hypothetical protein QP028_08490 [Corynebacterium suedekumii]|nr:hypothetical protein QP028_08490 [Corynebacterium suedekumii]
MTTWMTPYLQFPGTAREAMTLLSLRVRRTPRPAHRCRVRHPGRGETIMHAHLTTDGGWSVLASDCDDTGGTGDGDPSRSLCIGSDVPSPVALDWFAALAAGGGEVLIPLEEQAWGSVYGQVRDRFGVRWMFHLAAG